MLPVATMGTMRAISNDNAGKTRESTQYKSGSRNCALACLLLKQHADTVLP